MKVYYGGGNQDFETQESFFSYLIHNRLHMGKGHIVSAKILERRFLSNKGNALDGALTVGNFGYGLNIGGNPIGTGWQNYISFLEEIKCEKICGLYKLKSLVNKPIMGLMNRTDVRGYVVEDSLMAFFTAESVGVFLQRN